MEYRRLQWLAIGFPAALVGVFEYLRHRWLEPHLPGEWGNVAGSLIAALAVYGFVRYFTAMVVQAEQDLGRVRAEAAVLAERQRIGREMHDSLAQALFHLRVRLREVEELARSGDLQQLQGRATLLDQHVSAAYEQVRAIIADLKQQAEGQDPVEAVHREARRVSEELGLELTFRVESAPEVRGGGMQHLLSMVSEAMTNAARHGQATRVTISVSRASLTLSDNGRGFDPRRTAGDGLGLTIMEERAQMLGGHLAVESSPGAGTRIRIGWGEGQP